MATVALNEENFEQSITDNAIVIMDFWASWCGPCKSFGPIFEKASENYSDVLFAKINTEEEQTLASHFQIRSIPTTIIMKEQIVVFSQAGVLTEEAISDLISQVKALDMDVVRKEMKEQQATEQ